MTNGATEECFTAQYLECLLTVVKVELVKLQTFN